MVKEVNLGMYEIVKKHETNSHYDILLCNVCCITCQRGNFSNHKKQPKHINKCVSNVLHNVDLLFSENKETNYNKIL